MTDALRRMREVLRSHHVRRIPVKTHVGAVWSARSGCTLCDSSWLTADLWERHRAGCLAVDPDRLALIDREAHERAIEEGDAT